MSTQDPIAAGRIEILLTGGEWVLVCDGTERVRTVHPEQLRRESAAFFLANSERRADTTGRTLNRYKTRNIPRGLERRLGAAIDARIADLTRQMNEREDVRRIMRQPSSLQRHWAVTSTSA